MQWSVRRNSLQGVPKKPQNYWKWSTYGKQKQIQKKSLSASIRKPPRKSYF